MKILVTGAKGFIGKNLIAELNNQKLTDIYEYDIDTDDILLDKYCSNCDFVFHLAGVNRPRNQSEFIEGNVGLASKLIEKLEKNNNKCPVIFTSSIQAYIDNPYGKSKKAGEDLLFAYGAKNGVSVLVYRLPNIFGKWCKPNYNSVIATFCHNIANGIPIQVNDRETKIRLVYIDDLVKEFARALKSNANIHKDGFCYVLPEYTVTLGDIADSLHLFKSVRNDFAIPDMSDKFTSYLYSTYLSYLPQEGFNYSLKMNIDERGSFTEFIKTIDRGQISINVSNQGIIKGNHWHQSKNEKFLVVSGKGVIRLRRVDSDKVIEYFVDDSKLEVIDIPPGYTHNIENIGNTDMVTIMWCNEIYNPEIPDTYYLEV